MKNFKQRMIAKKLEQELSIKDGIVSVDKISCDGCGDCVDTCPFSAIDMKTLNNKELKELPFKGQFKVMIKGREKAFINQNLCTACGLCMKKCHEFAIHKVNK